MLAERPRVHLWLDDERPAPTGWTHARSVADAIVVMQAGPVEAVSLDHDLADLDPDHPEHRERTGYDLLLWMAEHDRWPRQKPTVHSANPIGGASMRLFIDRHWRAPDET